MTKKSPNDVSCVVWALGMSFFFVFYILTNLDSTCLESTKWDRVDGGDKNGP